MNLVCTVIRFLWVSAKFSTCTVVRVNGTLVEDKMRRFKGECEHFSFNKCPIYTHDGASAKFTTNSQEMDNSGTSYYLKTKWHHLAKMSRFDLWSKLPFQTEISSNFSLMHRFSGSFIVPKFQRLMYRFIGLGEQPPATLRHHHRGHPGRPLEQNCPDPPAEQLEVHAWSEEHPSGSGGYEPRAPQGIFYTNILPIFLF